MFRPIIRQNARRACKKIKSSASTGWKCRHCFFLHMTTSTVSQIHQSHPEVAEERDSCRAWRTSWRSSEPCWPLGSQTVDPGHCTWHCCTQTPERRGENWNWNTNQLPRHRTATELTVEFLQSRWMSLSAFVSGPYLPAGVRRLPFQYILRERRRLQLILVEGHLVYHHGLRV